MNPERRSPIESDRSKIDSKQPARTERRPDELTAEEKELLRKEVSEASALFRKKLRESKP